MSNVRDKELKQNMDTILTRGQSERMVISRHGRPRAVLVGIEDYDAEDLRCESSEQFWRMIRLRRASGKSVPLEEVEARLGIASGKPRGKRANQENAKEPINPLVAIERNLPAQSVHRHSHRQSLLAHSDRRNGERLPGGLRLLVVRRSAPAI